VADGGGGALQSLNVHIRAGVIAAVDSLGPAPGEAVIDGNGLVLAPGFIDIHPRGAGTFPRVLGRLVREQAWLTLPEAIRKMTSMPAARLGLTDRGTIVAGAKADLVLLDAATIVDRPTIERPRELSDGVRMVWVNGVVVWRDGAATRERPGLLLTR
jgi:N-acyl-D-amino-acid deacylase